MTPRDRAVYATSALLYSGPLYSGLAGYGMETIPVFAVFFALWLYVVRPGDWPRFAEDWQHPRTLAWPLLIFAVQIVVIAFCLAIGQALGALLDFRPPVPLVLSALMSMLAIALARLLQRPDRLPPRRVPGAALGIGAGILDIGRPAMPGKSAKVELVDQVLSAIAPGTGTGTGTGSGSGSATLRGALLPTAEQIEAAGVARDVIEALEAVEPRTDVLTLQSMIAFRPGVAPHLADSGLIARMMERVIASGNATLIESTAVAAMTLLTEQPGTARQFPPPAQLSSAAQTLAPAHPGASRALGRLVAVLEGRGA